MCGEEYVSIRNQQVCGDCIEDDYLRSLILAEGDSGECDYCRETGQCFQISSISERVNEVFQSFYSRTDENNPEEEYGWRNESGYMFMRSGQDVVEAIRELLETSEVIASDIQKVLEFENSCLEMHKLGQETEYALGSMYDFFGVNESELDKQWKIMQNSLKIENRFFNSEVEELFSLLFDDLDELQTLIGKQLLVNAGPDTDLNTVYRARSFQSDDGLYEAIKYPDEQLGPPPSQFAKAGRMNPFGISVFYGAKSPEVALAEVRPPVGSRVAIAEFTIIKPILLLDLSVLNATSVTGSYFDPEFVERKQRVLFLEELGKRIAEPVLPDHEKFEYLTTQFIADYLASDSTQSIDGILFPSVQASTEGEFNIVLFHESAQVEIIQLVPGTKISANNCGSFYSNTPGYNVAVEAPREDQTLVKEMNLKQEDYLYGEDREAVLRVNPDTIRVHRIDRIDYDTTELLVTRRQFEVFEEQEEAKGFSLDELINP